MMQASAFGIKQKSNKAAQKTFPLKLVLKTI